MLSDTEKKWYKRQSKNFNSFYLTTVLNRKEYGIPNCKDGENQLYRHRSMQMLGLVQELVNLNKKASDLPRTPFINLR